MKHIYAVGMKNWVELREAENPPTRHHSEVVLRKPPSEARRYIPGHWEDVEEGLDVYYPGHYNHAGPVKMSTIAFTGGKVLTSLKSRKFSRLTKIHVGVGGMIQLSPEHVEVLREKGLIDVRTK